MTVGELLKKSRTDKNLTIDSVERETKIKAAFIKALEEGDYNKLPSYTYARGFLQNYAQTLGLETDVILALFRREFDKTAESKLLPGTLERIPTHRTRVTTVSLIFGLLIILLVIYFVFQYKGFFSPPELTVTSPSENEVVTGGEITVAGRTSPDATVTINDQIVVVEANGNFEKTLSVFTGNLTLTLIAKNRNGRETKITREVSVK